MALTREILTANAATAALTDEQVNAIVEMSKNDENSVIGQKTGEIYGGLDADILAASGIAKDGTEKTYEYAKRVIGKLKEDAGANAGLQSQVAELTKEKARLEKVLAEGGGDAETKKALAKAQADLASVTKQYGELKATHDASEASHAKELLNVRIESEFAGAGAGLKFKADLPQAVIDMARRTAIDKVKGMNPEFIDDGNGGKVLAFMKDGVPLRNPDTNLKPYTATELVSKELREMGILAETRKQTGTGVTGGDGGGDNATLDLSGAKSQVEASEIVAKTLMAQGLTLGSDAYQTAYDKAWKDNATLIKGLPLR